MNFIVAGQNYFSACEILKDIDYNRNFELSFNAKVSGPEKNINAGIIYWGRGKGTLNGYNIYYQTLWKNINIP